MNGAHCSCTVGIVHLVAKVAGNTSNMIFSSLGSGIGAEVAGCLGVGVRAARGVRHWVGGGDEDGQGDH